MNKAQPQVISLHFTSRTCRVTTPAEARCRASWRVKDLPPHPARLVLPSRTAPPWLWNLLAGLKRSWSGRKRQSSMVLLAGLPSPSLFPLLWSVSACFVLAPWFSAPSSLHKSHSHQHASPNAHAESAGRSEGLWVHTLHPPPSHTDNASFMSYFARSTRGLEFSCSPQH